MRGGLCIKLGPICVLLAACGLPTTQRAEHWDDRWGALSALDVTMPAQGTALRPGVLLVHQGSWAEGDKALLGTEAARLAAAGFVTANANYRLAPKHPFPAPVDDVRCALAYFRAHAGDYGLDPQRVAVLGYSAGGDLSEMLGLDPAPSASSDCTQPPTGAPQAVVSGAGPANLLELPALGDATVADYVGGTKAAVPETYRAASPLFQVHAGAPPFLLVHGTVDFLVPGAQSKALSDALRAEGNSTELLLLSGFGHTLNPGASSGEGELGTGVLATPEAWPAVLDFLVRTLGAPP